MSVGLTGSINGAMSLEVPPAEEGSIGAAEGGGEGVSLAAGTFAEPLLEPFQIGAMVRCLWTRKPGVNEKFSTGHECAKVMGPVIEASIGKMVKALVQDVELQYRGRTVRMAWPLELLRETSQAAMESAAQRSRSGAAKTVVSAQQDAARQTKLREAAEAKTAKERTRRRKSDAAAKAATQETSSLVRGDGMSLTRKGRAVRAVLNAQRDGEVASLKAEFGASKKLEQEVQKRE